MIVVVDFSAVESRQSRLAIDYGTVGAAAVLAWPDGHWLTLHFDDAMVLPAGVHISPDG